MMVEPIAFDASIVTGRDEQLTIDCVESLFATVDPTKIVLRVFVTINSGSQELEARLKARWPQLQTMVNEKPRGFAENHNRVLRQSTARYCGVLNDDLVFLPGCLDSCVDYMEDDANRDVAMLSPKLLNEDRTLQRSTYSFPSVLQSWAAITGVRSAIPDAIMRSLVRIVRRRKGSSRFWDHDQTCTVDTLRGACVIVRRSCLETVGLMDEVALVGGEETEWHKRVSDRGLKLVFYPDAEVIHLGGRSVSGSPVLRNEYLKGTLNYHMKHSGRLRFAALRLMCVGAFGFLWVIAAIRSDPYNRLRARLGVSTSVRWRQNS